MARRAALLHFLRSQSKQLSTIRNFHSANNAGIFSTYKDFNFQKRKDLELEEPSVFVDLCMSYLLSVTFEMVSSNTLVMDYMAEGYHFCQSGTRPHNQCAKLNFNHASLTATKKRWASRAATAKDDNKISIGPRRGKEAGEDEKETGVVYYGPISSTIKKVKLLSLSTCCLSVSLGPVVTFMTSQDTNVILKGAVASSVIFLSASTTAALHWFVSPYIHKLRWQPGSDSFEVEMMSWLATFIPKTIKFADIRLPETNRPFVTFKANGNFYFVDSDHCHNKALLNRLTPQKSANESAFKNL
ncbi:hypothetical protein DKX38_016457 [Salix brachista]|uniref:Uncharacterized protein n=1 Tax=Salix brachista TaxID=2182728 RepID=A0A5N5L820_9ROSI|nr:hypothetical protein DKX38_016457 [Salix brachista]